MCKLALPKIMFYTKGQGGFIQALYKQLSLAEQSKTVGCIEPLEPPSDNAPLIGRLPPLVCQDRYTQAHEKCFKAYCIHTI